MNWKQFTKNVENYLGNNSLKKFGLGFLLMPWIIVWGWVLTLAGLCAWFLSSTKYTGKDPVIAQQLISDLPYPVILGLITLCIFVFYTISFTISAKYRWLRPLLLIISFYCLLLLSFQFYPYFAILLNTSI